MQRKADITTKVYLFQDADNLRAYADVTFLSRVGEITIRRFKVVSTDSGNLWVAMPQFEYNRYLSKKYVDAVVFSKRTMKRIQRAVLNEYDRRMKL